MLLLSRRHTRVRSLSTASIYHTLIYALLQDLLPTNATVVLHSDEENKAHFALLTMIIAIIRNPGRWITRIALRSKGKHRASVALIPRIDWWNGRSVLQMSPLIISGLLVAEDRTFLLLMHMLALILNSLFKYNIHDGFCIIHVDIKQTVLCFLLIIVWIHYAVISRSPCHLR